MGLIEAEEKLANSNTWACRFPTVFPKMHPVNEQKVSGRDDFAPQRTTPNPTDSEHFCKTTCRAPADRPIHAMCTFDHAEPGLAPGLTGREPLGIESELLRNRRHPYGTLFPNFFYFSIFFYSFSGAGSSRLFVFFSVHPTSSGFNLLPMAGWEASRKMIDLLGPTAHSVEGSSNGDYASHGLRPIEGRRTCALPSAAQLDRAWCVSLVLARPPSALFWLTCPGGTAGPLFHTKHRTQSSTKMKLSAVATAMAALAASAAAGPVAGVSRWLVGKGRDEAPHRTSAFQSQHTTAGRPHRWRPSAPPSSRRPRVPATATACWGTSAMRLPTAPSWPTSRRS